MGLLAKANAILEQEQNAAVTATKKVVSHPAAKKLTTVKITPLTKKTVGKKRRAPKLKKLLTAFTFGLAVQTPLTSVAQIKVSPRINFFLERTMAAAQQDLDDYIHATGGITAHERDLLAKMLYGEAGVGTDAFEVLHTVLNRMASPLFKGNVEDLLTQPQQYEGYRESNPVTPAFRRMVDIAIKDWQANDKKAVDGCNHYYFVTGEAGVCNKFEISHDHQGKWVAHQNKQYAKLKHYCPVAEQQAARYYQQYGHGNPRSMDK